MYFNPRARKERDVVVWVVGDATIKDFNPRARKERDSSSGKPSCQSIYFNPRARKERDYNQLLARLPAVPFQSTRP